jgi:hypothetical protein
MKNFYLHLMLLVFIIQSICASAQSVTANGYVRPYTEKFDYGSNMAAPGNGWSDETIADIIRNAGGTTLRPTLPDHFVETWGIDIRLNAFNHYSTTLGMKNMVCFIEGPSSAHQDKTIYPGNTEYSKLFANLYEPVWNVDSSVNQNNYFAYYVYRLIQTYGNYISIWEVVNEPDFTWGTDVSQWLTRAPAPSETVNMLAPFYHYIRMLRITWEVVKKFNPNDYVTPGGLGYSSFLDALLRYTDNPVDGGISPEYPNKGGAYFDMVSFHCYPGYNLRYWNNSIGDFSYTRNSDFAAAEVIKLENSFETVLQDHGYNGTTYPKKHFIVTETNVSRRTVDWRHGSDEMQRNYGIKVLVLAQKNNIKQLHLYGVAESMNAPLASAVISESEEYRLMGMYQNLNRDAPGNEKLTELGTGYKTTSMLLYGYAYDAFKTAELNLPADVDGAAFNNDGEYIYVLWAKNPHDATEDFSASYSFPSSWAPTIAQRMEWNYSATGTVVGQAPQGITLSSAPSFFRLLPTNTLPVSLLNFKSQRQNGRAVLTWSTSNEQTTSRFEIQRSKDGMNFSTIGVVKAKGSSSSIQQYYFSEEELASLMHYRLKIIDGNGSYQYSHTILISPEGAQKIWVVNPFDNKIELKLARTPSSKIEVYLSDISGKLIGREIFLNQNAVEFYFNNKLNALSKGVYLLCVKVDGQTFIMKIVKE